MLKTLLIKSCISEIENASKNSNIEKIIIKACNFVILASHKGNYDLVNLEEHFLNLKIVDETSELVGQKTLKK